MRSRHRGPRTYGAIAVLALLGGAVGLPSAAAAVDPAPIGPNQFFTGQVNGSSANAVIQVVCAGPVSSGETGHPVSGQSVRVMPGTSSSSGAGYTGSAADHVVVDFGATSTTTTVTLDSYAVPAAIPTTLNLPCSGTGKVNFVPAPTSSTARTATVSVTYENIAT